MRQREQIQRILFTIALCIIGFVMVFPFLWMVSTSFKTGTEVYSLSLMPEHFSLNNYKEVIEGSNFPRWFVNSFIVAGVTTASVLVIDPLVGYTFAKFRFRGKEPLFIVILSTLMIPTEMLIIPWFLMVNKMGWNNSYWSLLFPGLVTAFGIFLMRQFFTGIPDGLLDAGRIDGLSEFGVYRKIALPLVKPALSALGIFTFLGSWNAFLWPVVALDDPTKYTLPVGIALFSGEMLNEWDLIMTGATIATIPILIVFIIFQRQIIEGIQLTGVKG